MAELKKNDVCKMEVLSSVEYSEKYGNGITPQALKYAMENDIIDYICFGVRKFIVMTKKTKEYVPNESPKRSIMKT